MKSLLLLVCIFYSSFVIASEAITLANQKVLHQRLSELGLGHFVRNTHLDKTLGKKNLCPAAIVIAVECALYDYNRKMKYSTSAMQMYMYKPIIITEILKDHPEAITYLQERRLLN